jgi:uncharacterized protein (DUF488 family)
MMGYEARGRHRGLMRVYTLGYEGLEIYHFLALLSEQPITCVVDVRWTPLSRKAGFSKSSLRAHLHQHGYDYIHLRNLGAPKEIRRQLHDTQDWATFSMYYRMWAKEQRDALSELIVLAQRTTIGLLCFEADVAKCHRSLLMHLLMEGVADYVEWTDLSKTGLKTQMFSSSSNPILVRVKRSEKRTVSPDSLTEDSGCACIPSCSDNYQKISSLISGNGSHVR